MEFDDLPKADQRALLKELLLYTVTKMECLRWRGVRGGVPPGVTQAEDIVIEALAKFREGTRTRNAERYPLLGDQLRAAIDSLVWALTQRKDNKFERRTEWTEPEEREEGSPEAELIDGERITLLYNAFLEVVLENDGADGELMIRAFELAEQGIGDPRELERRLEISYEDARNLKKRMKRAMLKAIEKVDGRPHAKGR